MDSFLGLPAHALLVHAAVVLVPLAVVAFAALCWKKAWREHYLVPVTLLTVAGGIAALLAKQSGEPLQGNIRDAARAAGERASLGDHPGQGNTAFAMAFLFMLAVVAYWAADRWGSKWNLPAWAPAAGYVVVLVPAALALFTMLMAGHSGAVLVWKDVGTFKIAG